MTIEQIKRICNLIGCSGLSPDLCNKCPEKCGIIIKLIGKKATDEQNRELHELLGLCWHDFVDADGYCTCGEYHTAIRGFMNPDYATDPRLVLREMMKREDWSEFISAIYCSSSRTNECSIEWAFSLILDTTGLLRDKAIEFLKGVGR